jgi:hypothetical protein
MAGVSLKTASGERAVDCRERGAGFVTGVWSAPEATIVPSGENAKQSMGPSIRRLRYFLVPV